MHGSSRMTALTGHRLRIFENRALRRVQSCVLCQYVEGMRKVNSCVLCQYVTGAEENKKLCVMSVCRQELRRIRSCVLCQ